MFDDFRDQRARQTLNVFLWAFRKFNLGARAGKKQVIQYCVRQHMLERDENIFRSLVCAAFQQCRDNFQLDLASLYIDQFGVAELLTLEI